MPVLWVMLDLELVRKLEQEPGTHNKVVKLGLFSIVKNINSKVNCFEHIN